MRNIVFTILALVGTLFAYKIFGPVVVRAIFTGRWSMNGAIFDRSERPIMHYFGVLFYSLSIAMMTVVSCVLIRYWLRTLAGFG